MLKIVKRLFSEENYYQRLKELQPIILRQDAPKGMTGFYMSASMPVVLGGFMTAFFPYYNIMPELIPDIALYTCIYSSLHTSLLAGAHVGLACALYDPGSELKGEDRRYLDLQMIYPFFAPGFCCFFCCGYWGMPYAHLKVLYSIAGIGAVYIGVLLGDVFYADKRKTIPIWYRDLKMKITLVTLIGLGMLIFGIFKFPEETKYKRPQFPKMYQELYDNS